MTLYRSMFPSIEIALMKVSDVYGQFHGSRVRDLLIEHAQGRFAVDDHGGKLLLELQAAGEIEALQRAPTPSQAAFAGLYTTQGPYMKSEIGTWNAEHHFWRWTKPVLR